MDQRTRDAILQGVANTASYAPFGMQISESTVSADVVSGKPAIVAIADHAINQMPMLDLVGVQPIPQPAGQVLAVTITRPNGEPAFKETELEQPADMDRAYETRTTVPDNAELKITKTSAIAKSSELVTSFSREFEDDVRAAMGTPLQGVLLTAAGDQLARELNQEIALKLRTFATAGGSVAGGDGKAVLKEMIKASNELFWQSGGLEATYTLATADVVGLLQEIPGFKTTEDKPYVGVICGLRIYIDRTTTSSYFMVGHKSNEATAGAYFCPYQLLSAVYVTDPNSFAERVRFHTRNAIVSHPTHGEQSSNGEATNRYMLLKTVTGIA